MNLPIVELNLLMGEESVKLRPKNLVSYSDSKKTFTILLDERQLHQLLFTLTRDRYAWETNNPLRFVGAPWTLNRDPTYPGSWNVDLCPYLSCLELEDNLFILKESDLRSSLKLRRLFKDSVFEWRTPFPLNESGFLLKVRLNKDVLTTQLVIPHSQPNPFIVSLLKAFWSKRSDSDLAPVLNRQKREFLIF